MLTPIKNLFKGNASEITYEAEDITRLDAAAIDRAFARCFVTADGKRVISYLQNQVFARALSEQSTNDQLRFREGQRSLLARILKMIERGKRG